MLTSVVMVCTYICRSVTTNGNTNKKVTTFLPTLRQSLLQKQRGYTDEQRYCPECRQHIQATVHTDLARLPLLLALQLDRFRFLKTRWAATKVKTETFVQFPFALDMAPFVAHNPHTKYGGAKATPLWYDLVAVLNHTSNPGADDDEYDAFVKRGGKWYSSKGVSADMHAYMTCDID